MLDLFDYARKALVHAGVPPSKISESHIDTLTDPNYFSYYGRTRLGHAPGANGCLVVMKLRSLGGKLILQE